MSNFIELGKINFAVACECRKPKPGLILRACRELDIDPKRSILFGDSERDIAAAQAAEQLERNATLPSHLLEKLS